jgi:hypothetical protein
MDQTGVSKAIKEESDDDWLFLVEVYHPTIPAVNVKYPAPGSTYTLDTTGNILRLTSDVKPTVSSGRTFAPAAMEVQLLEQTPDRPPRAILQVLWASALVKELREIAQASAQPPYPASPEFKVTVKLVLSHSPDVVQQQINGSLVRELNYSINAIEIDLFSEELLNVAQPRYLFTPNTCPGLFG